MNILLTGGTGFVGGEVLTALKNHTVYATYRSSPGPQKHVSWVKLDLAQEQEFNILRGKKIDWIIHIGGATPRLAYEEGSYASTVNGTRLLLQLAKKLHVKKFIYISSSSAGLPHPGPYGSSKLQAEAIVKKSGIPYTILRPTTIIGKRARDFNRVAKLLRTRSYFPLIGGGKNLKSPVASSDVVKAIIKCCTDATTNNKVYLLRGKEEVSMKKFLHTIAKIQGNKINFISIPRWLAMVVATIANVINPRWGLNRERVRIITSSVNNDSQFPSPKKSFKQMISFLKR